jgi:hypothetical protein
MAKTLGVTGVFVLQIIIGVIAWVSVVAGGVVAIIGVLMALGVFGAREAGKHHGRGGSMQSAH